MNKCFSKPRDSSHRREGKNSLAEGLTFRSQRRLEIKGGVQAPTLPLSPGQAESTGHLHGVWRSWVSELVTRRREGREGGAGRGRPASPACLLSSLERESDSNAGHRKCEERKGGLGTCVCLSVFTSHLLLAPTCCSLPSSLPCHSLVNSSFSGCPLHPCLSLSRLSASLSNAGTHLSPRSLREKLWEPPLPPSSQSPETARSRRPQPRARGIPACLLTCVQTWTSF